MSPASYLPSAKFAVTVCSIAVAAGLIVGAQALSRRHAAPAALSAAPTAAPSDDWRAALQDIEDQSGVQAPKAPDPATVAKLLSAAQSTNLTTAVGRTLLVNLSSAKSQGLGDDLPTQDQLIAQASAQLAQETPAPAYALAQLHTTAQTAQSLKTYGNAVMAAVGAHPGASVSATYQAVGAATDSATANSLKNLGAIAGEYRAIADELAALPVPTTLAPLHLQVINDFSFIAATYADMATMVDDPLRGLTALQRYASLTDEEGRLFTNIAQSLNKNAILFNADEPGASWSAFLSSAQ